MRRKFLAFSLALAAAMSAGIYVPQVLAASIQTGSEAVNMEAETKMPIIKDDTGTITEEMQERLLGKFEQQFPDTDLSSFTVEYSPDDDFAYDNLNGDYLFKVYYKDVLVWDQFESNSRVFLGTRNGEDYEAVFKPEFAEACESLNFDNLIGEAAAKQVLTDAYKLSDSDNCDIQLVIYNYLTTGMMGSDKAEVAYKINLTGNHPDIEYIINAHSGDIIKGEFSAVPSEGKRYTINEVTYLIYEDRAEVESCDVSVIEQEITIPEEINGVPVTKINSAAFNGCVIQEITIPESIEEIGSYAFAGCTFEKIKLPDNLKKIETGLFSQSQISEIVIPESVTEIGANAFSCCDKLKTIAIPKNVEILGKYAFSYCKNLTGIIVEDGNQFFSSVDGVLFNYDKTELIAYPGGKSETSYSIPGGVITIAGEAFTSCLNLTEVNIPEGVEIIESNAFSICPELLQLKLPDTVRKLEEKAVYNCKSLSAVYIPKSVTEIGEGVFGKCDALTDIYYEGSEAEWNELVSNSSLSVEANVNYNSYVSDSELPGDVNLDGEISVADIVMLQKWLVNAGDLTCWQNADINGDEKVNVFDCCLLKRKVMENMQSYPVKNPEVIDEFTPCTATLEDDFVGYMLEVIIKRQYTTDPLKTWTAEDFKNIDNIASVEDATPPTSNRQILYITLENSGKENVLKMIRDIENLQIEEIMSVNTSSSLGLPEPFEESKN